MAIAFLSHLASASAPSGAERSLALLAASMKQRGHRVSVVKPGAWALERELVAAGVEVVTIPSRACWMTYFEPRPWPVAALKWLRWAWPQPASRRLAGYLAGWKPDLVHVNCLPHLRGAAAAAGCGLPVVWHLREILPPGRRRRWLAGRLRRDAAALVAVSEAVGAWVREEGLGGRLQVIPNGVRLRPSRGKAAALRREFNIPGDGLLVGLFGQLLPHKGAAAFVEAGRRALEIEPGIRFVLAGDGPEAFRREVAAGIDATGRPERFHLLGPQPGGERLIGASDAVCLATTTPDPLPRAVMEAMAAGKAVAAFRSGGTPEMVQDGETGLLVPVGDIDALAGAFVRLARDESLRRSLGEAAARRAREQFSLERHVDRMEAVFRGLVA